MFYVVCRGELIGPFSSEEEQALCSLLNFFGANAKMRDADGYIE
jgi:hypothetical protein